MLVAAGETRYKQRRKRVLMIVEMRYSGVVDSPRYRSRMLDGLLAELLSELPAVMVTGPRAVPGDHSQERGGEPISAAHRRIAARIRSPSHVPFGA
jgi:hypothetical protein